MKAFVLMCKGTGGLVIGYRVAFLDQAGIDTNFPDWQKKGPWQFAVLTHDGWVIEFPPDISPYPLFFNLESEKMFENLGEL